MNQIIPRFLLAQNTINNALRFTHYHALRCSQLSVPQTYALPPEYPATTQLIFTPHDIVALFSSCVVAQYPH
jgi:hypothetical protein